MPHLPTLRSSVADDAREIIIYRDGKNAPKVEVLFRSETLWLTQKSMATLFDSSRENITMHLKTIFETGELVEESVCKKFLHTAADGKNYKTNHYNLDAVIAVGYRVNSARAMYLDYAERQARLHKGKVTHEIAKAFAESEFEKFRVIQDKSYLSDFDKLLERLTPQ
jgi:hypothetical protein